LIAVKIANKVIRKSSVCISATGEGELAFASPGGEVSRFTGSNESTYHSIRCGLLSLTFASPPENPHDGALLANPIVPAQAASFHLCNIINRIFEKISFIIVDLLSIPLRRLKNGSSHL